MEKEICMSRNVDDWLVLGRWWNVSRIRQARSTRSDESRPMKKSFSWTCFTRSSSACHPTLHNNRLAPNGEKRASSSSSSKLSSLSDFGMLNLSGNFSLLAFLGAIYGWSHMWMFTATRPRGWSNSLISLSAWRQLRTFSRVQEEILLSWTQWRLQFLENHFCVAPSIVTLNFFSLLDGANDKKSRPDCIASLYSWCCNVDTR